MPMAKTSTAFEAKPFLLSAGVGRTTETFQADDIIFSQGDPGDAVFYIRKGKVKLAITSESGKDAVLSIMGPGDFFGVCCLGDQPYRVKTGTAMENCVILRIDKSVMMRELTTDPELSVLFIGYLLECNSRNEEALADQLFHSSEKRLARTLLLLANLGKDGKTNPVIDKISQETLAGIVGTTRSRISFFMNKFRRLGFIEYEGGVHGAVRVNSSLLNMVLHDGPGGDH
jgi:CRP-like cAMP-binding protein